MRAFFNKNMISIFASKVRTRVVSDPTLYFGSISNTNAGSFVETETSIAPIAVITTLGCPFYLPSFLFPVPGHLRTMKKNWLQNLIFFFCEAVSTFSTTVRRVQ